MSWPGSQSIHDIETSISDTLETEMQLSTRNVLKIRTMFKKFELELISAPTRKR